MLYHHQVYGLCHFCSGAAIIAPNHVSHLDPPIVGVSAPEEVHFLARKSLFRNRLFAWLISSLNAHPVSGAAGDVKVFRDICAILQRGHKLILFPEGTRSNDGEFQTIKPGIAAIAARTKCTVIPTYISGTFTIWNKHMRRPKLFGKTACVFGSPIHWCQFENMEKKKAETALLDKLSNAVQELRTWHENGAKGTPP